MCEILEKYLNSELVLLFIIDNDYLKNPVISHIITPCSLLKI